MFFVANVRIDENCAVCMLNLMRATDQPVEDLKSLKYLGESRVTDSLIIDWICLCHWYMDKGRYGVVVLIRHVVHTLLGDERSKFCKFQLTLKI